ncbi:MAG: TonB family protein [Deltaproteobacteria bacterium]|nr:TonB family protein [Deltaproteobacteria bacterium]
MEGTPLGRYVARLEDVILARWKTVDLPISDRARGVAGRVGVRYRVSPDGRTSGVELSASSGYALLDTLALRAIPERVPPFPAEMGRMAPLWHDVSLRYDNPYVATGL